MSDLTTQNTDIDSVFQKLRGIPANKTCFDCSAKNPTWSSITYGVFICIDCSAVHRSLGVHLTFVRSTQLDTNWTGLQLCMMQVGGNANALQFFSQHNCMTADTQKKYNSRAAQLYREKLYQLALKAQENKTHIHVEPHSTEEKEEDFFAEHEKQTASTVSVSDQSYLENLAQKRKKDVDFKIGDGPSVDFNLSPSNTEERKSTIARKGQPKKSGLGAKKGGLGATKVKANFAELEKEAALAEESRLLVQEETNRVAILSAKEQEERDAAVRLAYKDISAEQLKREEQLKKVDPRKAEQLERLGMGFHSKTGVSHSVLNDMQTIEQENDHVATSSLSSFGKLRLSESDSFFDEYSYNSGYNMNRSSSSKASDILFADSSNPKDSWLFVDEQLAEKPRSISHAVERKPAPSYDTSSSDIARKKFGSAKAISSDQFFNDRTNDSEPQANLSRFQGSSSISSSEYFGTGKDTTAAGNKFQTPDLDDVKESVRQGVTKVAGKISSLANGMMSSIQERYGY